nr:hypothetical protein [Liquorilactobacillus satsumensis]
MMKTVEEKLINSRTFITNVHQLANSYYISDAEAQSLLLDEILQHRLGSYNDQEIIQSLADNSSVFNWKITFAAKDVGKKISQQRRRESETVDMLKLGINDSFVINLSNVANSKGSDTARVIQLLPKLLRKKSTRDFISLTLLYGEIETRERLGITEKQFKKKIENIEAFCKRHRQRLLI